MLCYLNLNAQKVYKFSLSPVQTRVSNSLYNSLVVLDYRADTTSMGFIYTGMSELFTRVRPATPVSNQYKALFNTAIDSTATDGQLLLQIRRLLFAERADKGYFNMRAILYSKIGKYYEIVGRIDTLVSKASLIDPTNGILKSGDKIMTDFLLKNLKVKPSDPILSYHDILNITNVEKNELPLFNRDQYIDGLYFNYHSFKNQMPDRQITVNGDDLNAGEIRTIEGGGVTQKVKANNVYAIVYKGLPYVVSEGLYYPLKKVNNDFFFVGKGRVYVVPGDELVSDIAGDTTPIIVFSSLPTATFEMKIDYANGAFVRLKKALDAKGNPVK